jgi:hypothetical protein
MLNLKLSLHLNKALHWQHTLYNPAAFFKGAFSSVEWGQLIGWPGHRPYFALHLRLAASGQEARATLQGARCAHLPLHPAQQ